MTESKNTLYSDDRVWYDQFTSTDWVHDSIADAYRVKALRSRTDIRGKILASIDGIQGWILSALVGCLTAVLAYIVDVSESPFFDWKDGYCSQGFLISEKVCPCRVFLLVWCLRNQIPKCLLLNLASAIQYPNLPPKHDYWQPQLENSSLKRTEHYTRA